MGRCQNPAHFVRVALVRRTAQHRRRDAEGLAKLGGEMTVAREAKVNTDRRELAGRVEHFVQRRELLGEPSIAANNWFSDNNTFTTDAGPVCK